MSRPTRADERPQAGGSSERGGAGRGGGTLCVRLCDGRYFMLPRPATAHLSPARVCSAMCPAAETKVFNGAPEHAVAADGTRYVDLSTAFAFRERVVADCSCTGRGPGGLAAIDAESDPTLRPGDVVVAATGPTVFKGNGQFPYSSADFSPIEDYAKLNADLRRQLTDIRVDPGAQPLVPAQRLEATALEEEKPAVRPRPRVRRPPVVARQAEPPPPRNFFEALFR